MKICHIGFSGYPSIGSVGMYEFSYHLAKLGVDTSVIAVGEEEGKKEIDGVEVFFVKTSSTKNLSLHPLSFISKSLLHLKNFTKSEFDIIHIHSFPLSSTIPLLSRNKGKKWAFSVFSGPVRGGIISKAGWKMQIFESRFFDHIIFIGEIGLLQLSYRNSDEMSIVPTGTDMDLFLPEKSSIREKYGIDSSEFLFLYVGTLHSLRKIETLIEGLRMTNKKREAKLMIVGNGGTERLKRYAEARGMKDHVYFTGSVPFKDVPSYMNCCDVFLSYVPMTPGFDVQPPRKTREALACGLPIIATNTSGNRGFINHGENGYLTGDDALSLRDSMLELIENDDLREKFRKNARPSIAEYDMKIIVRDRLLPIYEKILG